MQNGQGCFGVPSKKSVVLGNEVFVYGGNGIGSTTVIPRFATIGKNVGTAITYSDSASLGMSCKINTPGVYYIEYFWDGSGAGSTTNGISRNSNQLATAVGSISNDTCLALQTRPGTTAGQLFGAYTITNLEVGDVVRPHGDGTASNGAGGIACRFRITQVA